MKPKDNITNKELEQLIISTCLRTGKYLNENAFNIGSLEWKHLDDPVTNLDKTAENMIRSDILEKVSANIIGEEYGMKHKDSNVTIYVDPIDGTKSYCRGEFMTSISVAAEKNNELVIGVVYDFMKDIMYYATNDGAFMKRSLWDEPKKLPAIDFQLHTATIGFDNAEKYRSRLEKMVNIRRPAGSIALTAAQLASGSYDGLIMKSRKNSATDMCDIAAGYFIMKKAGLYITDIDHNPFDYKNPFNGLIAINRKQTKIIETILE
ncbi:MAG: inositol monophosphatase family protein [Candidatus Woesearchaeota archaeon]